MYGNGSQSSPIVISDEEDAALVDRQLGGFEGRLTQPDFELQTGDVAMRDWGQQSVASSSKLQTNDYSTAPLPVAGQKRKRNQNMPADASNGGQESKSQRKKRRRAERLAAEQARPQVPERPPSSPVAQRTRSKIPPLPERPAAYLDTQFAGILPPVSWSASFAAHTATIPQTYTTTLPPKPPPSVPAAGLFSETSAVFPSSISQVAERRQAPPHVSPPFPAPAAHFPSLLSVSQLAERRQAPPHILHPLHPHHSLPKPPVPPAADAASPEQGPIAAKKLLGMPRESDKKGRQGSYPAEHLRHPAPDPARTLILAPIPKKFRNPEFVRHWAKRFARPQPLRVDVDKTIGKALVEFQSAALAEMAFSSQRLFGEGKEHIRAWWYRGHVKNPSDLEEGEIEEGVAEEPSVKKKQSKKEKKKAKATAQVPPRPLAPKKSVIPAMPVTLPLPVAAPISSQSPSTLPTNAFSASASKPSVSPIPTRRESYDGYGYRGWADYLDRMNEFGTLTDEESGSDGYVDSGAASRWYYGGPRSDKSVNHDEEQAMDLESDDEVPSPRKEISSPDSRYAVWGELGTLVDSVEADTTSIASSRAGSVGRVAEEKMRVDAFGPLPAQAVSTTQPTLAASASHPLPSLSPPAAQPLSPHVFTMVEPPTAPIALNLSNLASATHSTTSAKAVDPAYPATSTSPSRNATVLTRTPKPATALAPLVTHSEGYSVQTPVLESLDNYAEVYVPTETVSSVLVEALPATVTAKRTLLEKQRELEERIARAKNELARKSAITRASASRHTSLEEESSKPADPSADYGVADDPPSVSTEILSAESELRRSALKSRRKAGDAPAVSTAAVQLKASAVAAEDSSASTPDDATSSTASVFQGEAVNFDDLAISFITETLQTVQPSPQIDPSVENKLVSQTIPSTAQVTPLPPTSNQSPAATKPEQATEKSLLAARQKRLEQHIAETKVLMAKLTTAKSRAEKDNILSMLREQQRSMDADVTADVPSKPASPAPAPVPSITTNGYVNSQSPAIQTWKAHWPEPSKDAMILVLSDDEDDEDWVGSDHQ